MKDTHTFHIPVMGIAFTIDSPLKIAHLGVSSAISLVDDILLENLRKMYSTKFQLPFQEISSKVEDFRAKRITAYLNMANKIVNKKTEALRSATIEKTSEIKKYFQMLPDSSEIKKEFNQLAANLPALGEIKDWLSDHIIPGSIDVNIMTKIDKDNYHKGQKLPFEYKDAHAAFRGYAESDLKSSIVLSAGINPSLYNYMENFEDFFPTKNGALNKKIILKVSDYRSAIIQGKYLAKKGLWVSEYRIESGLNCGGHAFATEGNLMGPVLQEFRERRVELTDDVNALLFKALEAKGRILPNQPLVLRITAQGGVGTAEEHQFLLDEYGVDSVGWGTPFLLVPEATTTDEPTRKRLAEAQEKDLYLSNISPLGVPFNNLRNNTKDQERDINIAKGRPGSACPKKFVLLNTEMGEKALCIASYKYQRLKIKELEASNLQPIPLQEAKDKVMEKSCICVGLGTPAMLAYNLETSKIGAGISVCPGPNMAYFTKEVPLTEMTGHIYGTHNVLERTDRPNMFVKELNIYLDYLKGKIDETTGELNRKQKKYFSSFTKNLAEGIVYYQGMFSSMKERFQGSKATILSDLEKSKETLAALHAEIT